VQPQASLDLQRRFERVRLVVYGVLAASYMLVYFHRIAPGAVATELMRAFDTTGAALGSLAAMYFYVYAAMQIPAGVLADTLGVRAVGTVGALVAGAGSILFGLAPDFGLASTGRLLVGLGVSVVFVGMMRANAEWWSEQRYGFISGLTVFLGNVGAILAVAPLAALLAVASWRSIFVLIGVLSMAIGLLTYWLVRDRPEELGFPSPHAVPARAEAAPTRSWWRDLLEVLRNRDVWPGFFASFGLGGSLLAMVGLWAVPMLTDMHGIARAEASLYPSVAIVTFALASLGLGAFSDFIRRRKPVLVAACFASILVWLALLFLPWEPGASALLLFALLGVTAGGFIVTFGAAKEVVPPAVAGVGIAVVNTGSFLGAAVIQPLFGLLLDASWDGTLVNGVRVYDADDYASGLWLCLGTAVFAAVASLYVRETYCRNITVQSASSAAPATRN